MSFPSYSRCAPSVPKRLFCCLGSCSRKTECAPAAGPGRGPLGCAPIGRRGERSSFLLSRLVVFLREPDMSATSPTQLLQAKAKGRGEVQATSCKERQNKTPTLRNLPKLKLLDKGRKKGRRKQTKGRTVRTWALGEGSAVASVPRPSSAASALVLALALDLARLFGLLSLDESAAGLAVGFASLDDLALGLLAALGLAGDLPSNSFPKAPGSNPSALNALSRTLLSVFSVFVAVLILSVCSLSV